MNELYKNFLQGAKKRFISPRFTLFDVCNSTTALAKNIDNRPTPQIVTNATATAKNILEKIPFPFVITNWLRNEALNKAVGGVSTSQHKTGQAVDITPTKDKIEIVFLWIKNNLIFDQLILENGWIHVSFSLVKNRRQSLKLVNGEYIAA